MLSRRLARSRLTLMNSTLLILSSSFSVFNSSLTDSSSSCAVSSSSLPACAPSLEARSSSRCGCMILDDDCRYSLVARVPAATVRWIVVLQVRVGAILGPAFLPASSNSTRKWRSSEEGELRNGVTLMVTCLRWAVGLDTKAVLAGHGIGLPGDLDRLSQTADQAFPRQFQKIPSWLAGRKLEYGAVDPGPERCSFIVNNGAGRSIFG